MSMRASPFSCASLLSLLVTDVLWLYFTNSGCREGQESFAPFSNATITKRDFTRDLEVSYGDGNTISTCSSHSSYTLDIIDAMLLLLLSVNIFPWRFRAVPNAAGTQTQFVSKMQYLSMLTAGWVTQW